MRGLEVHPLDGPPLPKPAPIKAVAGKRRRRPLRDEEVAQAVAPEDADLFQQAMQGLGLGTPTADSHQQRTQPIAPSDEASRNQDTPTTRDPHERDAPTRSRQRQRADPVSAEEQALFLAAVSNLDPGIDGVDKDSGPKPAAERKRERQKPRRETTARRASLVIDDTLDLHRERQEAALERLRMFLVQSAIRRMTTVLVITGKGHHSEDGQGVLRRAVEAWLIQNGAPWVARYAEAPRHLGGSGAWVLTLQK